MLFGAIAPTSALARPNRTASGSSLQGHQVHGVPMKKYVTYYAFTESENAQRAFSLEAKFRLLLTALYGGRGASECGWRAISSPAPLLNISPRGQPPVVRNAMVTGAIPVTTLGTTPSISRSKTSKD